ncbi:MAG: class I SAM-dependent methyltransferase [Gammaproteobacteria bacterium]|jgi:predicted O-methyltransferase YrrM|nr:class I SAM-dependent methyltransferase [Gammaproteobacteria bacterium]
MNAIKNLVFFATIAAVIIVSAAIWWSRNIYDEAAESGFSRTVRETLYEYRDRREPRIILKPDNKQLPDPYSDYENLTVDWFTKKSPAWDAALADLKGKPDLQYLEVGAYEGRSLIWMLKNVLTHPTARATVIDLFIDSIDRDNNYSFSPELQARYYANLAQAGGTEKTTTLVGYSQIKLRELPLDFYDVIYIDGSHYGPDVLEDAVLAQRLLKPGGFLIFDDYRWFIGASKLRRSKDAVKIFLEYFGEQFVVLHNQYQMILKKVPPEPVDQGFDWPKLNPS